MDKYIKEQIEYGEKLLANADYALHKCMEWQDENNLLPPALREKLKAASKHVAVVWERGKELFDGQLEEARKQEEEEHKRIAEAKAKEEERARRQSYGLPPEWEIEITPEMMQKAYTLLKAFCPQLFQR